MTFRKLFFSLLAVALLVVSTGCDSNGSDDDESDAELFVDTWAAVGLTDGSGARTLEVSQFTVTFNTDTYGLNVVFTDQRPPIQFSGADYDVNEGNGQLEITIPAAVTGSADIPVTFSYAFSNSNETLALTVNDATSLILLNTLFQPETQYTAPLTLTLSKQ